MTISTDWTRDVSVLHLFARALAGAGVLTTRDETLYFLSAPSQWWREFDAWDAAGRPQKTTVGRHAEDWHRFLDAVDQLHAGKSHDAYMRDNHPDYWWGV